MHLQRRCRWCTQSPPTPQLPTAWTPSLSNTQRSKLNTKYVFKAIIFKDHTIKGDVFNLSGLKLWDEKNKKQKNKKNNAYNDGDDDDDDDDGVKWAIGVYISYSKTTDIKTHDINTHKFAITEAPAPLQI